MAKAEKTVAPEVATLQRAEQALEQGDSVTARALAKSVLNSALPADENAKELERLAENLTSEEAVVTPTLHSVAAAILVRTQVVPKVYALAAASAAAFVVLLLLAISRY